MIRRMLSLASFLLMMTGCTQPSPSAELDASVGLPPSGASAWLDGETERVLFEGTVATEELCYAPFTLPDGVLIFQGTKRLHVRADATNALKAGEYHFDVHFNEPDGRWGDAADTSEKVHTWVLEVGPDDWDPAGSARTSAGFSFECKHNELPWPYGGGILHGTITAVVVAERGV